MYKSPLWARHLKYSYLRAPVQCTYCRSTDPWHYLPMIDCELIKRAGRPKYDNNYTKMYFSPSHVLLCGKPLLHPGVIRQTCDCIRRCAIFVPINKGKQNIRPRIVRLIVMQVLSDVLYCDHFIALLFLSALCMRSSMHVYITTKHQRA